MTNDIQALTDSPDHRDWLEQISCIYTQGRARATKAANAHVIQAHWQIGRHIIVFEHGGKVRADYGAAFLASLSRGLELSLREAEQ